MKVKELLDVLSPYQNFQIGDSKTGEPVGFVTYLADGGCDAYDSYGDYDIYGIAPKVDKNGELFLAILVVMTI